MKFIGIKLTFCYEFLICVESVVMSPLPHIPDICNLCLLSFPGQSG